MYCGFREYFNRAGQRTVVVDNISVGVGLHTVVVENISVGSAGILWLWRIFQ